MKWYKYQILQQILMFNNSNCKQQEEISRYDLKKQLQGIESFDISSFGESKNQSYTVSGMRAFASGTRDNKYETINNNNNAQMLFPNVDAPTLELLEDTDYNIRYFDLNDNHHKIQQKSYPKPPLHKKPLNKLTHYHEDLTARNQYKAEQQYQDKIQQLRKELNLTEQKYIKEKKRNQLLSQKINLLQLQYQKACQEIKQKDKQLTEHIKSNSIHSSTVTMTSYMEDISSFCPELLSPEETVTLLSKLLKKVSRSSKMIKQLTDDKSVKTILSKIQKK